MMQHGGVCDGGAKLDGVVQRYCRDVYTISSRFNHMIFKGLLSILGSLVRFVLCHWTCVRTWIAGVPKKPPYFEMELYSPA